MGNGILDRMQFNEELSQPDKMLALGKDITAEYRLQKTDGTTIWVCSRGSAYSHPDGVTVLGTTRDITDHKQSRIREKLERNTLDI